MNSNQPRDSYEQFVKLFMHHEPSLRAFVRSMICAWDDVDEVMQNTGLVLWRKFSEFDPTTDFMNWACVVARFEVLAFRRDKARDRTVFDEDVIRLLADEASSERETLSAERRALEVCLKKLPENRRRIVLAAYEPGIKVREVAERLGKSATAFYKMLNRIRVLLLDCVRAELANDAWGTR